MKHLLQNKPVLTRHLFVLCFLFFAVIAGCNRIGDHLPPPTVSVYASGLANPMGLATDTHGNVWVAESGDGNNNGKVVVVTKDGITHDAIVDFVSVLDKQSDDVEGPAHLLLDGNLLYILAAEGKMYIADVTSYKPGDLPIEASALAVEDIGSFVLSYPFVNNAHDTHPYNITKGPDGDLYIADAAANAIIHRRGAGNYCILAEVPGIPNLTTVGPPVIESVPTGIIWDGNDFLVTTLLGFPFPTGEAIVYKISLSGAVSVYQQGFTSLVDIAKGNYQGHLVLQHAIFGATGFAPNTGALLWANGSTMTPLADRLNLPVGLIQVNERTWYVTSLGDGTIVKIAYP